MIRLNNNIEIPQIGVGTWTLRGETARRNVRLALEAGFPHVDTAQGYENEAEVGQGIMDKAEYFTVMAFDVKDSKVLNSPPLIPSISRAKYQRICMLTSLPVFTPCI